MAHGCLYTASLNVSSFTNKPSNLFKTITKIGYTWITEEQNINQLSLFSFAKSSTSLCTGRSKNFLSPSLAVMICTFLTSWSRLGNTLDTTAKGHWFLGDSLSQTSTTSPSFMHLLGVVHFWRFWSKAQYSFCQRNQSWLARYWTLRHLLREYWSGDSNFPGGGNTTWVLSVSRWFGVRGSGANGSVRFSIVKGRQFTIHSASVMSVRSASSSSWVLWFSSSDDKTERAVRIWRSQIPPMCEAWGTLRLKSIQSQSSEDKYSFRDVVFSSLSAAASSFFAPTKLVPWSDLSSRTFPLRLIKRLSAFRNESVVIEFRVSKCIAREERQVNISPHLFNSFRPSLM